MCVIIAAIGGWNGGWNFLSQPTVEEHYPARKWEGQKHVPWISLAIPITYTVIFIIIMQQNDCPSHPRKVCLLPALRRFAFQPFGENPLLGPSAKTLLRMGALESDLVTKVHEGWRLLSTMWIHSGVLHITGTALGILVIGIPLERQLGFVKVLQVFSPTASY
jgi:membrane associated rhomboid family serine protease